MPDTPRIRIAEAGNHTGETVEIAGWLYNLRRSGKIVFPLVRDGSGIMQCVGVKAELPEELFEELKNLTQESSFCCAAKSAPSRARRAATRWTSRARRSCSASARSVPIRSRRRTTAPSS